MIRITAAHRTLVMVTQWSFITRNFTCGEEETIIRERVVVFSVLIQVSFLNEAISSFPFLSFEETHRWSIVFVRGYLIPSARDGHSACLIHDRMYIFGGFEDDVNRTTLSLAPSIAASSSSSSFRINNFPMICIISILSPRRGIITLFPYVHGRAGRHFLLGLF